MSILKIIEINAASTKSFEDAVRQGISRTAKTVHKVCNAVIDKEYVTIEDGQIKEFHVEMKMRFEVEQ